MLPLLLFALSSYIDGAFSQCQSSSSLKLANTVTVTQGLSTQVVYNGLKKPRGIKFDDFSNMLVLDAGVGVLALTPNTNGCKGWEKKVLIDNPALNHGIELVGTRLWVSTPTEVLEFLYEPGSVKISSGPVTLIKGLGGGSDPTHGNTHTLQYQPSVNSAPAYLLVATPPEQDVQPSAVNPLEGDSQIRRFALNATYPDGGFEWTSGQLVAYGLRNSVGMTIDSKNMLWATDNGADVATWKGQNVEVDNPADEINGINLNNVIGGYYGYPTCATAWNMTSVSGPKTGEQFAALSTANDTFCNTPTSAIPPVLAIEAHSAPLDMKFFTTPSASDTSAAIKKIWVDSAFVSLHGSANRKPQRGFGVIRVPWNSNTNLPRNQPDSQGGYEYIVQAADLSACPGKCIRPVGLQFDTAGRLFVSSDTTGEIFLVQSGNPASSGATARASFSIISLALATGLAVFFLA